MIKKPEIKLLYYFFAIGIFTLFFLRKFVLCSKSEFLPVFFIYGALYYLLFYIVPLLSSDKGDNKAKKTIQSVFTGFNLLFYLSTTAYIFLKYYSYSSFYFFIPAVLLFNVGGAYSLRKYFPKVWSHPNNYSLIFLLALTLPVFIQDSSVFLFSGVFSLFMLFYSIREKEKAGFYISLLSLVVCTGIFLIFWLGGILPSVLLGLQKTPPIYFLLKGIFMGIGLLALLLGSKQIVSDTELPISSKYLDSHKFAKILNIFLFSVLFMSACWLGYVLLTLISGSTIYTGVGCFITGSIFFSWFIHYFTGRYSALKKPTHYAGLVFVLLYPVLTLTGFVLNKDGSVNIVSVLIHYIALGLFVFLAVLVIPRVRKRNKKKVMILKTIQLLMICYLFFLLFTEFSNLSLIVTSQATTTLIAESANLFPANYYFPFTILLSLVATLVYIYATLKKDTFLKIVSFFMIVAAMAKLFLMDMPTAPDNAKGTIFIITGIYLFTVAILSSVLLKNTSK